LLQFGQLTEVAISVLIMLYAPYQSFKAIKSISKTDDTKWLTFWVIYAGQYSARSFLQPLYNIRRKFILLQLPMQLLFFAHLYFKSTIVI
jgi:hypothetical protein